jgi:hypothetical protein
MQFILLTLCFIASRNVSTFAINRGNRTGPRSAANQEVAYDIHPSRSEMEEANLLAGTFSAWGVRKRSRPLENRRFGCRDADSEAEENA